MDTKLFVVNDINDEGDIKKIEECAGIIKNGGLVAFPTETVYGLGGNALDDKASMKIYSAKGRPSDNPLIVHIADMSELEPLVKEIPDIAKKLAKLYWPGPLTMIFKKSDLVPYKTTGGLDTVAVRMPSHKVAREFIRKSGLPIAAPSANVSGRPSPTTAKHVMDDLDGRIDAVIDGGQVDIGLESTIIDVSSDVPMLLRPGFITMEMLEEAAGDVERDPTLTKGVSKGLKPKAPGMMYRHYAPKGDMAIVEGAMEDVIARINHLAGEHNASETAVITTTNNKDKYTGCRVFCIGDRNDDETIAKELYAVLREMDDYSIKYIYVESFKNGKHGEAIMNRLVKAAGHKIIHV